MNVNDRIQARINRMWHLYNTLHAEDLAQLTANREQTQYTHKHRALKHPSGKPPIDYAAVETLIDFKAAMDRHNYDEAANHYYTLIRMIGGQVA